MTGRVSKNAGPSTSSGRAVAAVVVGLLLAGYLAGYACLRATGYFATRTVLSFDGAGGPARAEGVAIELRYGQELASPIHEVVANFYLPARRGEGAYRTAKGRLLGHYPGDWAYPP